MVSIDKEFQTLIPALGAAEFEQLEQNILSEGIRDPLVVWRGLLLDGHNRLEIAERHELEYRTVEADLPDRDAACLWIVRNQLGRRNLTPQQMSYLRGKWYEREKLTQGTRNQHIEKDQNDTFQPTAARIAQQTGVSAPTIKRDAEYSRAVDVIAEAVGDEARDAILSAETRLSKKDVIETAKMTAEAPDLVGEVAMGGKSVPQVKRELTRRQKKEAPPLPSKKYRIVYADPPWSYGNKGLDDYGHAERHYPSMTIAELCTMGDDIKEMIEPDAVLFLWVTSPLLAECFPVIKAWGFKYKTSFVWDKVGHNFGHYNSVRHELLLVCTRGSCTPDASKLFDSVQSIEKSHRHSEKPERFREIIDTLYTHGKRIELFSRCAADGWDAWGNE